MDDVIDSLDVATRIAYLESLIDDSTFIELRELAPEGYDYSLDWEYDEAGSYFTRRLISSH